MSEQRALVLLVEDTAEDELAFLTLFKEWQTDFELRILRDGAEALAYFFGEHAE